MATGMTDRGRKLLLEYSFNGETVPSTYNGKLVTDASVTKAINTFSELSEVPAGSGYSTGGVSFSSSNVTVTEVDSSIGAKAEIADDHFSWSLSGTFPASGTGATFLVITDGTGSDNVLGFVDLGGAKTGSSGGTFKVNDVEFQINES